MRLQRVCVCGVVLMAAAGGVFGQDVLRGEVRIDVEPVYALPLGLNTPLDDEALGEWAREEAARSYAAMIYGWSFVYEPGEAARSLAEKLTISALGVVRPEDPRLKLERVVKDGLYLSLWSDYHLSETQKQRLKGWRQAGSQELQSAGSGALTGKSGNTERESVKDAALEDAARQAIRARLRASLPNRPLRVKGRLALSAFPSYGIEAGRWVVNARFHFTIDEVEAHVLY